MHSTHSTKFERRSFLKLGLAGSTLLAGAGLIGSLHGCSSQSVSTHPDIGSQPLSILREKDVIILSAIAPVALKGNFPTDPDKKQQTLNQLLINIDSYVGATSELTIKKVHQMFDLLYNPVFRSTVAGIWSTWPDASDEDIEEFLTDWRDSRINTFRQGFLLLTQLPAMMFYFEPDNWSDTIYPGPPQHIPS